MWVTRHTLSAVLLRFPSLLLICLVPIPPCDSSSPVAGLGLASTPPSTQWPCGRSKPCLRGEGGPHLRGTPLRLEFIMSRQVKRCLRVGWRRWWHAPFFFRLGRSRTQINQTVVDEVVEQAGAGVVIEFLPETSKCFSTIDWRLLSSPLGRVPQGKVHPCRRAPDGPNSCASVIGIRCRTFSHRSKPRRCGCRKYIALRVVRCSRSKPCGCCRSRLCGGHLRANKLLWRHTDSSW